MEHRERSDPHDHSPPSVSDIASLFGLEDLRIGRHYLRDADQARIGSLWVESLWQVDVVPSFHTRSVLCVICAKGEALRKTTTPNWHKAVFATPSHSAIVEIDADPVAKALNGFDLFRPSDGDSLDGIAYKILFETVQLRGSLSFSNPSQPHLVALESALNSLACQIARRSNVKELGDAVEVWNKYIVGRG